MVMEAWQELPFEKFVEQHLKKTLSTEGSSLWSKYVLTREEMMNEVLPWIVRQEPNLTDHGPRHIANVINNAAKLLGFQDYHSKKPSWKNPEKFTPHELLVLLTGLLLHDVGNVLGRDRHNQRIPDVWKKTDAWSAWSVHQRPVIIAVGRAHSGKTNTGNIDTLEPLSTALHNFDSNLIRAAEIAAIIRFADELAEGPQRTSKYLLSNGFIDEKSLEFHKHAEITTIVPDRVGGRVAISYVIDIDNANYPTDLIEKRKCIANLLSMAYARAIKMNYERQFARYYSKALSPFRETSISVSIEKNGSPLNISLSPINLKDIDSISTANISLEKIDSKYSVDSVLEAIGLSGKE